MTETKFTPAPWIAKESYIRDMFEKHQVFKIIDDEGDYICDVFQPFGSVANHNAHLIAAAPEMYMTLEKEITFLTALENIAPERMKKLIRDGIAVIEVALKKARGEDGRVISPRYLSAEDCKQECKSFRRIVILKLTIKGDQVTAEVLPI